MLVRGLQPHLFPPSAVFSRGTHTGLPPASPRHFQPLAPLI